jgi:hypothetical protein
MEEEDFTTNYPSDYEEFLKMKAGSVFFKTSLIALASLAAFIAM